MPSSDYGFASPGRSAVRGLAWLVGAFAWLGAAALGAVLAVLFAATVVVISVLGSALLFLSAAAVRARRSVGPRSDPDVLEARQVGGHSWVAYGWDGPS